MRLHIFLFEVLNHSDLLDPDTLVVCYVAPGPFKVGGSIISLILIWLPDPQKQPEAYHTFAALNGLCLY